MKLDNIKIAIEVANLATVVTTAVDAIARIKAVLKEDPEAWNAIKHHFEESDKKFQELLDKRNVK